MKQNDAFAIIPVKLLDDPSLDCSEKMTLVCLLSFANRNGRCWPSLERIAQRAGISRRGIMNILNRLDEKNFIKRTRRKEKGSNEPTSTIYRIGREYISLGREPDSPQVGNHVHIGRELRSPEHIHRTIPIEQREPKKTFGEYENVFLSDREYGKFVEYWGSEQTEKLIATLADYKLASGKKYKNDAAAIRSWVIGKVQPTPIGSSTDTLPKALADMHCPKCGAMIRRGELACPGCDVLVADMVGVKV